MCDRCAKPNKPTIATSYCTDCDTVYFNTPIKVTANCDCSGADGNIYKGKMYDALGIDRYKNRKHYIILDKDTNTKVLWGVDRFESV